MMSFSNNSMGKCFIIIVNYKKWEDTVECIRSVFTSSYSDYTIVVIDNNSQNQSIEKILESLASHPDKVALKQANYIHVNDINSIDAKFNWPELVLIQNKKNAGFAAANNAVLKLLPTTCKYVWLLNPDVVIEPDTLAALISCSQSKDRSITGSVAKNYYNQEEVVFYGGGRVQYLLGTTSPLKDVNEIEKLHYISGSSLFTRHETFQDIGLLPEEYFLYWEETDWCYRAKLKGYHLNVCMSSVCYDKIGSSVGRGYLADYYYMRNGLYFLKKYNRLYVVSAILVSLSRVAIKLLKGETNRARGIVKGVLDFIMGKKYENK